MSSINTKNGDLGEDLKGEGAGEEDLGEEGIEEREDHLQVLRLVGKKKEENESISISIRKVVPAQVHPVIQAEGDTEVPEEDLEGPEDKIFITIISMIIIIKADQVE